MDYPTRTCEACGVPTMRWPEPGKRLLCEGDRCSREAIRVCVRCGYSAGWRCDRCGVTPELRIGLCNAGSPENLLGCIEYEERETWCGVCAKRLGVGDCFLSLFDGENEIAPVCESCALKSADEIERIATAALRRVDAERERVAALRETLATVSASKGNIKGVTLSQIVEKSVQVAMDMRASMETIAARQESKSGQLLEMPF